MYYAQHRRRGFVLTPDQVSKFYRPDPSMEAKGGIQRRPLEKSVGVINSKDTNNPQLSRAQLREIRFPSGVSGVNISADALGGYSPKGYGGITQVFLFVDLGNAGGYLYPLFYTDGVKDVTAKATQLACLHWDQWGHMKKDWSTTFQADSGSFSSTATAEVFNNFKIKPLFSAPDRQAQNPIEAHIKPLIGTVCKLFARAEWVPRPFWTYAISYACKINNKSVHADEKIPPDEQFKNQKTDFVAHPLLPWGQPVEVMIHPKKVAWKFGWKSVTGIYLDTPDNVKGSIIYFNMSTKQIRIGYTYKLLEYMPLAHWPVYKGDRKDYTEKQFAESVNPCPDDEEDERLVMGGDPNKLPPALLEDAVYLTHQTVLDPVCTTTMPIVSHDTATADAGPIEEVGNDPSDIPVPEAAILEEVNVDSGPILECVTPDTTSIPVNHSLVPHGLTEEHVLDDIDVEPTRLNFDLVTLTSIDKHNQLLPGADFAYRMSAEEVETLSVFDSDDDDDISDSDDTESVSDVEEGRVPTHDDKPKLTNKQKLKKAIEALQEKRKRTPRSISKIQRKINIGDSDRNVAKSYKRLQEKRQAKAKRKIRTDDNPTLTAALAGPYRELVKEAIEKELTQYVETYEALRIFSEDEQSSLSQDQLRNAITSHYEITYKRDKNTGALIQVKARLVIHGNETNKYSFEDIKSPTARTACIKILLSLMAKTINGKSFKARSWDVTGAFLQTNIKARSADKKLKNPYFAEPERILMRLPDGRIGELLAYAYGLKQASVEFYSTVDDLMKRNGFLNSVDPCIYVKEDEDGNLIIVGCHVDDFLAVSNSDQMLDEFTECLRAKFGADIKERREEDGDLQFIGMNIHRCTDGNVYVTQAGYIKTLWKRYSERFGLKAKSFFSEKHPLFPRHASTVPRDDDNDPVDSTDYRGIVGALNYLALMTRPDISEAMSFLSTKCNTPTKADMRAVKHLFRYIIKTAHLGLNFKSDGDVQLYVWADASYLASRSQSGYCFTIGRDNAVFFAKSQRQHIVTISSTEAEYVALFHSITEVMYLTRLLAHMGFAQGPVVIFQDNISTIHWAECQQNFHRVKHMAVKYNYVQEKVEDHSVAIEWIPTDEMVADILTKPVVNVLFEKLTCKMLGICSFEDRTASDFFYEFDLDNSSV